MNQSQHNNQTHTRTQIKTFTIALRVSCFTNMSKHPLSLSLFRSFLMSPPHPTPPSCICHLPQDNISHQWLTSLHSRPLLVLLLDSLPIDGKIRMDNQLLLYLHPHWRILQCIHFGEEKKGEQKKIGFRCRRRRKKELEME